MPFAISRLPWFLLFPVIHPVAAFSQNAASARLSQNVQLQCPGNLAAWESLRQRLLALRSENFSFSSIEMGAQPGDFGLRLISACFEGPLRRLPEEEQRQVEACFGRAVTFAGFPFNARTRQDERTAAVASVPRELLDPELSLFSSRWQTMDRALQVIARLNAQRGPAERLIAVPFVSQVETPAAGSAKGRLLVYVPGNPARFVNFASELNDDRIAARNISVVAVEQAADGTRRSYFQDYDRQVLLTDQASGRAGAHKPVERMTAEEILKQRPREARVRITITPRDCHSCHTRGPIPIAFEGMLSSPFIQQIRQLNAQLSLPAPPVLENGHRADVLAIGPGLGPIRERSNAFMDSCLAETPGLNKGSSTDGSPSFAYRKLRERVREAMNCAECHAAGREALPLTHSMNNFRRQNTYLWLQIQSGAMPKNHKYPLEEIEREGLYRCLMMEYYGVGTGEGNEPALLQQWLFERSCTDRRLLGKAEDNQRPKAESSGRSLAHPGR